MNSVIHPGKFRLVILTSFLFCMVLRSSAQSREQTLHNLNSVLINAVMDDIFNPVVSSRIYTYPNITFYECIRQEDPGSFPTLTGKLTGLTSLPAAEKGTDLFIAAVVAYSQVGQSLIGSEYKMEDWRKAFLDSVKNTSIDTAILSRSVQYGKQFAAAIIAWIKKDQYAETRAMPRSTYTQRTGHWQPTPVEFAAALEPNWRFMRPMTLKKPDQFAPKERLKYSMEKNSVFYKTMMEVYKIGNTLDSAKTAIAWYWDDNPNITVERGHLMYTIHKVSPAGHWVMITRQACLEKNIPLIKASQAYALTTIALYDAFIACWDEKFKTDLIRPVTVIKRYINEKWDPLIQTPPFPEFTSGHAVISNAAAAVLTGLLGDNYSFTDNTEIPFGIKPRTFPSFLKAAEESSMSRVYGGIHYPETARISIKQGREVGYYVLNTLLPLSPKIK